MRIRSKNSKVATAARQLDRRRAKRRRYLTVVDFPFFIFSIF